MICSDVKSPVFLKMLSRPEIEYAEYLFDLVYVVGVPYVTGGFSTTSLEATLKIRNESILF